MSDQQPTEEDWAAHQADCDRYAKSNKAVALPRHERIRALHAEIKFWKRLCAMLATLLLACAIVIGLAYFKLP